uniref:ATP synthase F0 subunit 6 n=1 Tax=Franciscoloa roseicapillae TaxID=2965268 RepID=UPI0026E193FE|nr:ATP synthase F0 subunit 6 [Franciscoloa roseicapillae]WIM51553.1 ATP synthase subunit 6 [Franciscoloa roseicapillae]WIM51566.1 ATP synthase subunit 6 [Franciscoloa roseicapillae]
MIYYAMMASLLSIFDPSSSTPIMNWAVILFLMLFPISTRFWALSSSVQLVYTELLKLVNFMSKTSTKMEIYFVSIFMMFLLINLGGLMPYSFSLTSHFNFNFSLALTLWLGTMLWGFSKHLEHNLAHLTPMGCPLILVPFMVLVETISSLIRPITLSLRLMSNMLAGHMILALLSKAVYVMPFLVKPLFFSLEALFLVFELGVSFIQTYVFYSLMLLYWQESD